MSKRDILYVVRDEMEPFEGVASLCSGSGRPARAVVADEDARGVRRDERTWHGESTRIARIRMSSFERG
jgi:hypothetical protein